MSHYDGIKEQPVLTLWRADKIRHTAAALTDADDPSERAALRSAFRKRMIAFFRHGSSSPRRRKMIGDLRVAEDDDIDLLAAGIADGRWRQA